MNVVKEEERTLVRAPLLAFCYRSSNLKNGEVLQRVALRDLFNNQEERLVSKMKSFEKILAGLASGEPPCSAFFDLEFRFSTSTIPSVVQCRFTTDWKLSLSGDVKIPRYTLTAGPLVSAMVDDGVSHARSYIEPLTGHCDQMFGAGLMVSKKLFVSCGESAGSVILIDSKVIGLCSKAAYHYFPHYAIFDESGFPNIDWNSEHIEEFQACSAHEVRVWRRDGIFYFISELPLTEQERGIVLRHMYAEAKSLAKNGLVPVVVMESKMSSTRGMVFFVLNGMEMEKSSNHAIRRINHLALELDAWGS